jgi:DNA-binding transcriptional MerR regulator
VKPADELLLHDLRAPIAKIKTALSLMPGSSMQEMEEDYLPILQEAINEIEKRFVELTKRLEK